MNRRFDPITPRGLVDLGRTLSTWWQRRRTRRAHRPARVQVTFGSTLVELLPTHPDLLGPDTCRCTDAEIRADFYAANEQARAGGVSVSGCGALGHGWRIHTTRPDLIHPNVVLIDPMLLAAPAEVPTEPEGDTRDV